MNKFRNLFFCAVILFVPLAPSGLGSVQAESSLSRHVQVGEEVFLGGKFIEVGVSKSGSFGTASNAPEGFHPASYGSLGFVFDGDGFGIGEEMTSGDYFLPGSPYEGFIVGYKDGESLKTFMNAERNGSIGIPSSSIEDISIEDLLAVRTSGATTDNKLKVEQTVSIKENDKFFKMHLKITNNTEGILNDVRYMSSVDPDIDLDKQGTFDTLNSIPYNFPVDSKSVALAKGPITNNALVLMSTDSRSRASIGTVDPYSLNAFNDEGSKAETRGDNWMGLTFALGNLEPGQSETIEYFYSLDSDIDQAIGDIEENSPPVQPEQPAAPPAPSVSVDDVTNTIIGMETTMEYQIDEGEWIKYDASALPDLSGNKIVKIRVAADLATGTPAGEETTLVFTANPTAPSAPVVTMDDVKNTIVGLDATMEYQLDGGEWTRYDSSSIPPLNGNKTVKIRFAADLATDTPAGEETTLIFTLETDSMVISFDSQGGSSVESKTANYSTIVAAPSSPTKPGFTFAGWYKDLNFSTKWNFDMDKVTSPTVLYAKWTNKLPINPYPTPAEPTEPVVPINPTTPSQPQVEEINVDVETGTDVTKTPVKRTTEKDGTVKDEVTFTDEKVKEAIGKLLEQQKDTAKIVIPDADDKVKEVTVQVPKTAVGQLAAAQTNLEIFTENVLIRVPENSMQNFNENLFFRLVPLKTRTEKDEVELRAKRDEIVQNISQGKTINVLGRPMIIETNMERRPVTLTLPLLDSLPKDSQNPQDWLNNLAVYIEHDDGTHEVLKGRLVMYKDGGQGIEFDVDKFSTFTLLYMDGLDDYLKEQDMQVHTAYIKGFPDNTFRLNAPVTRRQMAAMLARNSSRSEDVGQSAESYKDVQETDWAYSDILHVQQLGIMFGDGQNFNPNGNITRAQMARVIYRWVENACENDGDAFAQCPNLTNILDVSYTDVSSKHAAVQEILAIKQLGIMEGYEDGTFRPEEKLTRAQAVKVLNRLFKRGPLYGDVQPTFKDVPTSHWAFRDIEEAARNHKFSLSTDGKEMFFEEVE